MIIREYGKEDAIAAVRLWNSIVRDGNAFPQDREMSPDEGDAFFSSQSLTAVADEGGAIVGLYILHPNNVGRCGHIANASYAVDAGWRGRGIGRMLVADSLARARGLGFRIMQFNAVVSSNASARKLYESLGFHPLGIIKGGFRLRDGGYEDICPYWREL